MKIFNSILFILFLGIGTFQASQGDTTRLQVPGHIKFEGEPTVKIALQGFIIQLLLNGETYWTSYTHKGRLDSTITLTNHGINRKFISTTDQCSVYASTDNILIVKSHGLQLIEQVKTLHDTAINNVYLLSDKTKADYLVTSSTFPNFKLWQIINDPHDPKDKTKKKLELKSLGEKRGGQLLAIGSDNTAIYAMPYWWKNTIKSFKVKEYAVDIQWTRLDKHHVGHGITFKAFKDLNLTNSNINNYKFYYNGAKKNLYVKGVNDFFAYLTPPFHKNVLQPVMGAPDFINILFLPDKLAAAQGTQIAYLTKEAMMIQEENKSDGKKILLINDGEEILDGIIKGNHLFYVTKKGTQIFLNIKDIAEEIKTAKPYTKETLHQEKIRKIMEQFTPPATVQPAAQEPENPSTTGQPATQELGNPPTTAQPVVTEKQPEMTAEKLAILARIKAEADETERKRKLAEQEQKTAAAREFNIVSTDNVFLDRLQKISDTNINEKNLFLADSAIMGIFLPLRTIPNDNETILVASMPNIYKKFVLHSIKKTITKEKKIGQKLADALRRKIGIDTFSYAVFACPTKNIVATLIKKVGKGWNCDISYLELVQFVDYVDRFQYLNDQPLDKPLTEAQIETQIREKHKNGLGIPWALDALTLLNENGFFNQDDPKAEEIIKNLTTLQGS
jgi:hypothetical protein